MLAVAQSAMLEVDVLGNDPKRFAGRCLVGREQAPARLHRRLVGAGVVGVEIAPVARGVPQEEVAGLLSGRGDRLHRSGGHDDLAGVEPDHERSHLACPRASVDPAYEHVRMIRDMRVAAVRHACQPLIQQDRCHRSISSIMFCLDLPHLADVAPGGHAPKST